MRENPLTKTTIFDVELFVASLGNDSNATHSAYSLQLVAQVVKPEVPEPIITVDDTDQSEENLVVVEGPLSVQSADEVFSDDSVSLPAVAKQPLQQQPVNTVQ